MYDRRWPEHRAFLEEMSASAMKLVFVFSRQSHVDSPICTFRHEVRTISL
jgi:hypothetical protein